MLCSLARKSPDCPPDFASSRMSVSRIVRSTALHMSYIVNAATDTAVSASISTPVCPATLQVASISIALR